MDPQARTCRNSLKNEAPATAGADQIGCRLHGFESDGDHRVSGVDAPGSAKKLRDDAASTLQDALALICSQNQQQKENKSKTTTTKQPKNNVIQLIHTNYATTGKTKDSVIQHAFTNSQYPFANAN